MKLFFFRPDLPDRPDRNLYLKSKDPVNPVNPVKKTTVRFMSFGALLIGLFLTPDQQGQRWMEKGGYAKAAAVFEDPMRRGTAWYKAGEFKKAEAEFRKLDTPEGHYNRGNALVFMGKYEDAVKSFDRALELKPEWEAAQVNRGIAAARAKMLEGKGDDLGDQQIGADEIVFDKKKNEGGQETELDGGDDLSQDQMQSLWLRRVQTRPADFLKAKFAYQTAMQEDE